MPARAARTVFLRTIGGLDDPRRGDERSNRVWSEAGAVAQQAQFYAAILVGAIMAWVGGRHVAFWSIPVIWIAALGNVVTSSYLAGRGAAVIPAWRRLASPRGLLLLALLAVWAAGFARAIGGASAGTGLAVRFIVVLALILIGSAVLTYRRSRRVEKPEDDRD
jgi:hypothetical protein